MAIYKSPRYTFLCFLLILFVVTNAQNVISPTQDSLNRYNKLLSVKEMQEDLKVLLTIRKNANSGLFAYHSKAQIDSIYKWAWGEIKTPMRALEFYKIILRLSDFEGSCHNYTELDSTLLKYLKRQKSFFPYPMIYLNGQIIFDARLEQLPAGSRILNINGVPDTQLMQSFYKYYPTDGNVVTAKLSASVDKAFGINFLLEYGLTDTFEVDYQAPNSKISRKIYIPAVSLEQREQNEKGRFSAPVTNLINFKTQAPYSFRMIQPSIGLLNLRWFGMVTGKEDPAFSVYAAYIDSVFCVLSENKVSNLIIDVRNNPGGADPTFEQPVRYLTKKTFRENRKAYLSFAADQIPDEKYFWGVSTAQRMDSAAKDAGIKFLKDRFPEFKEGLSLQNQKYNPDYKPLYPQFKGKIYLLINEQVASAGSHFASLVKGFVDNVTIIGVETRGGYYVHNGHVPLVYELPNSKIKTQFSIVHVIQDAPLKKDQPEGSGVMPDYEVWPALDDFMQQKDTQLNFVLDLIKKS